MIASNVSLHTLESAAASCGLEIKTTTLSGSGRRHRVKVNPGKLPPEALTPAGNRRKGEVGDNRYQRVSLNMDGSERRVAAVCWHGFRDFFRACFAVEPDARFKTAMDTWGGSADFEARFAASGHRNIGSAFMPLRAADACRCEERGYSR